MRSLATQDQSHVAQPRRTTNVIVHSWAVIYLTRSNVFHILVYKYVSIIMLHLYCRDSKSATAWSIR